ncbi:NAD(+) diphosphatase [Rhizobium sp. SGZ-381]|uniref:NAD(+) diphosphatase n=1 Tax=Rhizobium sp. SGZ-381 TaxID=3342800 RepID=UPI00366E15C1
MTLSLFDTDSPHGEASRLTAFTGNRLDRDAEHRTEDSLDQALAVGGATLLAFSGNRLLLKETEGTLDPLFDRAELEALRPDLAGAILLGKRQDGSPRLAVPVLEPADALALSFRLTDPRSALRDGLVAEEVLGEVAQAVSLLHWNEANRFCGKCGTRTQSQLAGYKRICPACAHMMFPRTDPVVIMLTVDEARDRVLLGRGHHFTPGMYSALAGFVEPAETIEDAVRRETREESGIVTGRVRYHASQPWPMPHSLMIGCYAEALSEEIHIDAQELEDCRWFSRAEVLAMLAADPAGEGPSAPMRGAIAHRLLRDWVEWNR